MKLCKEDLKVVTSFRIKYNHHFLCLFLVIIGSTPKNEKPLFNEKIILLIRDFEASDS